MTLPASIRRDAATLSARLPSLVIAARRVTAAVAAEGAIAGRGGID